MGELRDLAFSMLKRRGLLGMGAVAGGAAGLAGGVAGLMAPKAAHAQSIDTSTSKLQQVLDRGYLIVGTGSTNPPWHFEDETGTLVGMDIDMAQLIAKGLFEDPEKVEFVLQGSDARIPEPGHRPGRRHLPVDDDHAWPGAAGRVHRSLLPRGRRPPGDGRRAPSTPRSTSILAAGSDAKVGAMQNVFIEDWVHMALPEAIGRPVRQPGHDAPGAERPTGRRLSRRPVGDPLADADDARPLRQPGLRLAAELLRLGGPPGRPIWLNWVNTVYREAMLGVDFDVMQASYKKWFGIDVPTPLVGFPQEFS